MGLGPLMGLGPRRSWLLVPLALLASGGVVALQGVHARRTIERLPEAEGIRGTRGGTGEPLHLVVLGDSVAAGVGVAHHDETIAGRLSELLAAERPVRHTVLARSGLTAAGVLDLIGVRGDLVSADLATADLVVLSVGVNDTKGLHGTRRWRRELVALLDALTELASEAHVVLLGIPDMALFTRLPRPLRSVLGAHSRAMERVGRDVARAYPRVTHLPFSVIRMSGPGAFATDGFHPSAALHAELAGAIAAIQQQRGATTR